VLWEIISGLVPFGDVKKQDDIRDKVRRCVNICYLALFYIASRFQILCGERPKIPPDFVTGPHSCRFEQYISLIRRGWAQEAELRPSSLQMKVELENIWQNVCQDLLYRSDTLTTTSTSDNESQQQQQQQSFGKAIQNAIQRKSASVLLAATWNGSASDQDAMQAQHSVSSNRALSAAALTQLGNTSTAEQVVTVLLADSSEGNSAIENGTDQLPSLAYSSPEPSYHSSEGSLDLLEQDANSWLLVSHTPPYVVLYWYDFAFTYWFNLLHCINYCFNVMHTALHGGLLCLA
jgi:hypothetical protein